MGVSAKVLGSATPHSSSAWHSAAGLTASPVPAFPIARYSRDRIWPSRSSACEILSTCNFLWHISVKSKACRKRHCAPGKKQTSVYPAFGPMEVTRPSAIHGRYIIVEAAKRGQDKPGDKNRKLPSLLEILKEDKENGSLGLNLGNGSWLHKMDELEELRESSFLDAVVKVYCTSSDPNFSLPWQKKKQSSLTGSGFMIAGRRLLTNAHCVEHHTQVKVKRRGDDTKYVASVLAVGPECDLALLSVESDAFWEGVTPLEFGGLPYLQDPITVVGYPIGGETISVTSGVVSRIEITSYSHASTELLGIQIDAAINAGNSGGPAFNDKGECVGIAFQSLGDVAENIGYVIPTTVIMHFLRDYERHGKFTGFPVLGVRWQKLENSALRAALQMKPHQKGILLRKIEPTSPSFKVLEVGDVILKFDGVPVANEGTVPFRAGERIGFDFLVSQKFAGDKEEIEVLRNGEVITVQTVVTAPVRLVPTHIDGKLPSYLIVAGVVFTFVCQPFLDAYYGDEFSSPPVKILEKAVHGLAEFEDEQLVVVSQVLAHDVNVGYEELELIEVVNFNGVKIRNLKQLAQLTDACTDTFMRFDLGNNILLVLETNGARESIPKILSDHCIPSDRSQDLM